MQVGWPLDQVAITTLRAVVCKNHPTLESDPLRICSFSLIWDILGPKTSFRKIFALGPILALLRDFEILGQMTFYDFWGPLRLILEQNKLIQWDFLD